MSGNALLQPRVGKPGSSLQTQQQFSLLDYYKWNHVFLMCDDATDIHTCDTKLFLNRDRQLLAIPQPLDNLPIVLEFLLL